MLKNIDDLRIASLRPITSPALLITEFPLTDKGLKTVIQAREAAEKIVKGEDDRLLCIVGPCSIHDVDAALAYAELLKQQADKLADDLVIVMRVYFEKPRTTIGWKGLINDPHLDNSFDINTGLRLARSLLVDLADKGMPAGTEFLDSIIPQYICDAISWGAIGARTTESQVHRELVSGLSMPIGFKNGTGGSVKLAVDAIGSARHQHHFLSISKLGVPVIAETTGNNACHVILRGASTGPNYDAESIQKTIELLQSNDCRASVMVDCSHGNSQKDHNRQPIVVADIAEQIASGSRYIMGAMIESNLVEGNQAIASKDQLRYGQSITDACVAWDKTVPMLEQLASAVRQRRQS